MKDRLRTIFVCALVIAALFLGPAVTGFAGEKHQETCPVMGYQINKQVYADHQGKRIYFCCASCIGEFKKDPDKYLKKIRDEGVVLEDVPKPKEK